MPSPASSSTNPTSPPSSTSSARPAPPCSTGSKSAQPYEELLGASASHRPDIFSIDETAIAELFYTSGSTGTPKGVMLSHRTLYLHAFAVMATFAHTDDKVELHTIPLFHANGWGRAHSSLTMGLNQVMVRRFDPAPCSA